MTYLLFATAVSLSAIAAYYSIVGLMAIFAAAAIPIAVMGSVLEVSKLVVASWLYRNWKTTPKLLKSYFVVAVVVLMLLTSMGIFGFLSKAHSDQSIVSGDVMSKLSLIEEKIKTQRENIDAARKTLTQLDAQVDSALSRTTDAVGVNRSANLRRSQQSERGKLLAEIEKAQSEIGHLNEAKAPIAAEVRKVEAEVGPLKYIAALIYGNSVDGTALEKSVRMLILMIVFVFDPLAVLMFIAVNQSLAKEKPRVAPVRQKVEPIQHKPEVVEQAPPPVQSKDHSLTIVDDIVMADSQVAPSEDKGISISSTVKVTDVISAKLN